MPPPPPQRGGARSVFKALTIIGMVIVLGIGAVVTWSVIDGQDDADTAAQGDCVINNGTDIQPDVEVVDCTSSKAEFKVAEKHDGDFQCNREKYAQYSETKNGDTTFTLCLTPHRGSGS
ncbi:LppU/SCO3897 family protein [Streptomyces oceani]|nr:hypothetical protein [Streptomyces oceani]